MSDPADVLARRRRDARIRELNGLGWSYARIGSEVGLSKQRVMQILADPDPDDLILEKELTLRAELADLVVRHEGTGRRISVVRRALDRIAEEREARHIDRILGLTTD